MWVMDDGRWCCCGGVAEAPVILQAQINPDTAISLHLRMTNMTVVGSEHKKANSETKQRLFTNLEQQQRNYNQTLPTHTTAFSTDHGRI